MRNGSTAASIGRAGLKGAAGRWSLRDTFSAACTRWAIETRPSSPHEEPEGLRRRLKKSPEPGTNGTRAILGWLPLTIISDACQGRLMHD
jgi:hypothetical protein